jgi:hypothetical protein
VAVIERRAEPVSNGSPPMRDLMHVQLAQRAPACRVRSAQSAQRVGLASPAREEVRIADQRDLHGLAMPPRFSRSGSMSRKASR